jgi:hypothetical protein
MRMEWGDFSPRECVTLLSAMAGGGVREEGWARVMKFQRDSKIHHTVRRGFLEDEGVRTRKERGGGDSFGSVDLVGRPNPSGLCWASASACGILWGLGSLGQVAHQF